MKRKIDIGTYNALFALAEVGLQESWEDLGLSDSEIVARAALNKEFNVKDSTLPPIYFLQKKYANCIVDDILKRLNIGVDSE